MRSRIAVLGVVMVLVVVTACGSRTDPEPDATSSSLGEENVSTEQGSASLTDNMFGTMESPCGPGDASGSTDVGVSDDTIAYSSVSDSGGQIGGLNKGIDDSQAAFVKWCNDQGGINGRKLELNMRNAALFDYGTQVAGACEESLSLVGGLAVFDDVGAQAQVDCGLPNVPAAAVSSVQAGADLTYMPLPSPPNHLMAGGAQWIKRNHPEWITHTGIVHAKVASLDYITGRLKEAYGEIGYEFVYDGVADVGESNWPAFVVDMKAKDVQVMTFVSSWEEVVNLQNTMAQQDFKPEATQFEANFYQQQYPAKAGGNAEGSLVQIAAWPFEEADSNPATTEYLAALEAAVPGAQPELLGMQSFSAGLMWAAAVKSLGSDVTRQGIVDALENLHEWNGGGLHGTSDPGAGLGSPCFILLQVQGDGFVRKYPTTQDDAAVYDEGDGFSCDPSNIVDLPTNWDKGAKVGG